MHVWLINPPNIPDPVNGIQPVVRNLFYNSPPLGLAYLGGMLEAQGHRVTITDAPLEGMTPRGLTTMTATLRPDLIGFTSTTTHFEGAVATAEQINQTYPDTPIILGGPHFQANPEALLQYPVFRFGVEGEGEHIIVDVVRKLEAGEDPSVVPGVVARGNGGLIRGGDRKPEKNLDLLARPARHLLPILRYRPLPNDQMALPKTSMVSSRGCPFRCNFCHTGAFSRNYRSHSPEFIVDEMHQLERDWGIRDIAFVDSTFTPTRSRIEGIVAAMEKDPPKATWSCSSRADVLDEKILRRMKAVGCWRVRFAVESGNDEILKSIQKDINTDQVRRVANAAANAGIQVKCFFMVGHADDTPETIEQTIRFAQELPLKDVTVQINTPLKGTEQYAKTVGAGAVVDGTLSRYNFFQPVYVPKGMTAEMLVRAQRDFYRRFYLRPSVIWRHLRTIRRPTDIAKYIRVMPLFLRMIRGSAA